MKLETKNIKELGINFQDIPDNICVIINKDDLEVENDKKLFQFALKEELDNENESVMVYSANFDKENKIVKPLLISTYDENGYFKKDLFYGYPPIYEKNKEDLIKLEI